MARKVATVKISTPGRDVGKVFVLTELSAYEAEDWAARALFAMLGAGIDIPDHIASAGLSGVAALGIQSLTKIPYLAAKPLLDDMLKCIQIQPSPKVVRELIDSDIEEVSTLLQLRQEIFSLHLSFFTDGAPLTTATGQPSGQAS